jgi:hypothetical protein
MALYSLDHDHIAIHELGAKGRTAGHLIYIVHSRTTVEVVDQRTGLADHSRPALREYCAARAAAAGKNGRIVEKIIVALPLEATRAQQVALMTALAEHITQGAAPYVAVLHAQGRAAANPHAHIAAYDEPWPRPPGGKGGRPSKIIGMSRKGALEALRAAWTEIHNGMMTAWGYGPESMIDHRSYRDRGIDRLPTIHEGPRARAIADKGQAATSKTTSGPGNRAWAEIDEGSTRAETNALVRRLNAAHAQQQEHDDHGSGPDGILRSQPCGHKGSPGPDRHGRPGYRPIGTADAGDAGRLQGAGQVASGGDSAAFRVDRAVEPPCGPAAGVAEGGDAPAVADDRRRDRPGRYRPSALVALIAQAEAVGRRVGQSVAAAGSAMAAVFGRVDWRRITPSRSTASWGPKAPPPATPMRAHQRAGPEL